MMHDSSCGCPDCADFHPNRFDKVGNPETGRAKLGTCDVHSGHHANYVNSCINWKPIEAESSPAPKCPRCGSTDKAVRPEVTTEIFPNVTYAPNKIPCPHEWHFEAAGAAQSAEPCCPHPDAHHSKDGKCFGSFMGGGWSRDCKCVRAGASTGGCQNEMPRDTPGGVERTPPTQAEIIDDLAIHLALAVWTEWHGPMAKIPATHDEAVTSLRMMLRDFYDSRQAGSVPDAPQVADEIVQLVFNALDRECDWIIGRDDTVQKVAQFLAGRMSGSAAPANPNS